MASLNQSLRVPAVYLGIGENHDLHGYPKSGSLLATIDTLLADPYDFIRSQMRR